ncbi:MAG: exonuclease SbcCD subunit D C-terminal domain-containing protein, partial [Bacteroidota bacterium]
IEAGQFPDIFDYVALGHIHQAQRVGGHEHVRYSGSLVPLTFGEARQPQSVCVFDLGAAGEPVSVKRLTVPRFRDLLSVRGTAEEVFAELEAFHLKDRTTREEGTLAPWLEVRVETPHPLPLLREELTTILEKEIPALAQPGSSPEVQEAAILRTSLIRPEGAGNAQTPITSQSLSELDPEEVFHRLCHGTATGEREDYPALLASFRELRTWMEEETTEA